MYVETKTFTMLYAEVVNNAVTNGGQWMWIEAEGVGRNCHSLTEVEIIDSGRRGNRS